MQRLGANARTATLVAAAALFLLPVFWIPNHTCTTHTAGRAHCLGCVWGVLATFVLPLAGTAALLREERRGAAWRPARVQFLPSPPAVGRAPPFAQS